jgi:hypothetical protein
VLAVEVSYSMAGCSEARLTSRIGRWSEEGRWDLEGESNVAGVPEGVSSYSMACNWNGARHCCDHVIYMYILTPEVGIARPVGV